jgi:hypothetical protein
MNDEGESDDEGDNPRSGDGDSKRKRLNKFLDDKKLDCEKCIVKLKRKNKKIKIIYYSLLTLSVVGQTVASIVAPNACAHISDYGNHWHDCCCNCIIRAVEVEKSEI